MDNTEPPCIACHAHEALEEKFAVNTKKNN